MYSCDSLPNCVCIGVCLHCICGSCCESGSCTLCVLAPVETSGWGKPRVCQGSRPSSWTDACWRGSPRWTWVTSGITRQCPRATGDTLQWGISVYRRYATKVWSIYYLVEFASSFGYSRNLESWRYPDNVTTSRTTFWAEITFNCWNASSNWGLKDITGLTGKGACV